MNRDDISEVEPLTLAAPCGAMDEQKLEQFADLVRQQLELLGEDSSRDGLERTPLRVAKAYQALTCGYWECPKKVLNDALFDVKSDEMVIVKDIDFYSSVSYTHLRAHET